MKKTVFAISLVLAVAFVLGTAAVQSQPTGGQGMGQGMMADTVPAMAWAAAMEGKSSQLADPLMQMKPRP